MLLNKSIEEYKNIETSLRNALLYAQNTAEDMKKNATQTAQDIVHEAEVKARDKSQELAHLKNEVETYKTKIKSFCNGMLEMLEKME